MRFTTLRILQLAAFTLIGAAGTLAAIDEAFVAGKDTGASDELQRQDKVLDERIRELCTLLQRMHTLHKISTHVTHTPVRTIFRADKDEDGEFIELLSYVSVPGEHNGGRPVGTNAKWMRLYFSGDQLVLIRTVVNHKNFQQDSDFYTTAVHPQPLQGADSIVVTTSLNSSLPDPEKKPQYSQNLRSFENSPANPARLKFKRDFYVPHLAVFENLFRQTFELQKRNATGRDVATVQRLQRSLRR